MENWTSGYGPYLFIVIDVSEIGVDIGWLFDRLAVVLFRVRGQCDTIRIGIDRDLFDDEYIPGHSDRNIGTFYFEVSLSENDCPRFLPIWRIAVRLPNKIKSNYIDISDDEQGI